MSHHTLKKAIIQNLKDAGCDTDTIAAFMKDMENGEPEKGLKILAQHRQSLLKNVHEGERCIGCLDYLIYQLQKEY